MNNIEEKYLPIGTVVMLKEGTKRLMITGFCSMPAEDTSTMYDYSGCMFPEGVLSSDQTALFNHDQIAKVYHMGLVDDEEKQFKNTLKSMIEKMNNDNTGAVVVSSTEESIPAIGPGLPGYVAPQTVESVPPVGPGLPGYVEPQAEISVPPIGPGLPGYVEPTPINEIKFDSNGVVISDGKSDIAAMNGLKFDENGVVIADFQFDENN